MICAPNDARNLEDVERLLKTSVPRAPNPLDPDVEPASAPEAAPAAPSPDATPDEDAPAPRRTRTRGGRGRAPKPEEAVVAEVEATAAPDPSASATPADAAPDRLAAAVAEMPPPREERAPRSRGGRARGRRDEDGGPSVVGMGDHLPGFIEKSFEERLTG